MLTTVVLVPFVTLIRMKSPLDNINKLEVLEKEIALVLQYSGQLLAELAKEKSVAKQIDNLNSLFTKETEKIFSELSQNINYLFEISAGQQHEGSSYKSQKSLQLSLFALEHLKSRMAEIQISDLSS